ncbi:MAG: ribonuclease HI [Bacteroidetes bacterium]|nr:ribonuclease HI [Bacteroidota bacterium]MCA0445091.1 ribonuclease HI [Bacteroidota bacterium]
MRKEVIIYTDGACSGNPGPGGWGAILMFEGVNKEISGFDPVTTNNRMELTAVIRSLEALKEPCNAKVHSDSAYIINAFHDGWIQGWLSRGWLKSDKKPVENQDLWKALLELTRKHNVDWIKVKGHSNDVWNNRADALATGAIKNRPSAS